MKIQYYGTAAAEGWPGVFCRCEFCIEAAHRGGKDLRTRSQALIDDVLLVDYPPDSYCHMLRYGLKLPEIQHLIVTHSHEDHFYPLDFSQRRTGLCENLDGVLHIYGNNKVGELLKKATSKYEKNFKESLSFHPLEEFKAVSVGSHSVTPLRARHDKEEDCFIFLIEREGEALLYGNDSGVFPEETFAYLSGKKLDIVSLDCTYIFLKTGDGHMGLDDDQYVIGRRKESGCLHDGTKCVVTHFSHHGEMLHAELEEAAGKMGFIAAYDGMTVC
jgi:phosphoribosyl 1,2-cyclic phosphate phosphodiesterase